MERTDNTRQSPALTATSAVCDDTLRVCEVVSTLAAAGLQADVVGGAIFVNVPPGYTHKDISDAVERVQLQPRRKRGAIKVADVVSLLAVCADQGNAGTYVYADPDSRTICAVFNDHRGSAAGWRDHRASFTAEFTPEFSRWIANNGNTKSKGQTEFAEFVEDNAADILAPASTQLLEVATTIQASTGIEFKSAKRLDNGQAQLTYVETIDARAGADGGLVIPREFELGLRIFKNGEGYKLRARLKYRLGSGSVKFWYELDRPERAVEDAFAGYVKQVRESSGYPVLLGVPGGDARA